MSESNFHLSLYSFFKYALLSSTAQDVQQQKTRLLPRLASEALRLLSSPPGAQRTFNAVEFDELASYSRLVLAADARDEGFMQGWVNSQLNGVSLPCFWSCVSPYFFTYS
jgi:hypothetical protein